MSTVQVPLKAWQRLLEDLAANDPNVINDVLLYLFNKTSSSASPQKVFIVHGRDEGARLSIEALMHKLNVGFTVLGNEINASLTLIELLEKLSESVCFAVVILTPDDCGYLKEEPNKLESRARQNVILELGYFIAKLGRERISILVKGDVEMPSDCHGIWLESMENNEWRLKLAKNMQKSGIYINLELL